MNLKMPNMISYKKQYIFIIENNIELEEMTMKNCIKKQMVKLMSISAALSFIVANVSANTACSFITNQKSEPMAVKNLRKF